MRYLKSKITLAILILFAGLNAAYGQSKINISWEIRNYYVDADNPKVEVFLVLDDNGGARKEFIFFSPGEAVEISKAGQFRVSAWHQYTTYEYRYLIENKTVRVQKQELEYSREIKDFKPVPPGWKDVKKIPIASGKTIAPQAGITIPAKSLFRRDLSLQTKRLNGDDVWALQRFLSEREYGEVGEVDGWFGPNTEKAVKKLQRDNNLNENGVVDNPTWTALAGWDKEQVNFFRGDYGD